MMKKRLIYTCIFLVLLAAEILIGSFAAGFVRAYIGDVLIVPLLWALLRIFFPCGLRLLPVCIFGFAVLIELLQGINIAELLGIENELIKIIIGSTFDFGDILCYAAGCGLLLLFEQLIRTSKERR